MRRHSVSAACAILALSFVVWGCGGHQEQAHAQAAPAADHEKEHGQAEQGPAGSRVAEFHDVLAPLWHAPESPQRVTDTCAAAPALHQIADKMVSEGAPAGATPVYLDAAKGIVTAVSGLEAACAAPDRAGFSDAFTAVHNAFHATSACVDGGA